MHWTRGAHSVIVTFIGSEHGDPNSNPGQGCLHFTLHIYLWKSYESVYFPSSYK